MLASFHLQARQKQMHTVERKVSIVIARHNCKSLWLYVSDKVSFHLTIPMHRPWKLLCLFVFFLTSTVSFTYWKSFMSCPGLSSWGRGKAHLEVHLAFRNKQLTRENLCHRSLTENISFIKNILTFRNPSPTWHDQFGDKE